MFPLQKYSGFQSTQAINLLAYIQVPYGLQYGKKRGFLDNVLISIAVTFGLKWNCCLHLKS